MERDAFDRRRLLRLSGATLLGTFLAGCSGGSSGGGETTTAGTETATDTPTPTRTRTATTTAAPSTGTTTTTAETATSTETGTGTGTGTGAEPGTATPATVLPPGTIELGGRVAGWMGRVPAPIEGQTNPTLALEPGGEYEIVWENVDGVEHELIIEDASGESLAESESAERRGERVSMRFTADERMSSYYCEYHPTSMRGAMQVGD